MGGGENLRYCGRRRVQRTVTEGRRQRHPLEGKQTCKKNRYDKKKFTPLFLRRVKASGGEGEAPLDAQAGKRLMKERIDRCVDSLGLSDLSCRRSDAGLQKE